MNIKKSLLMAFMFVCVMVGAITVKTDAAKADDKPYYIKVNKGTNVVTVYKQDGTAHKAFVCSTGAATPTGTFYTSQKLRWHVLMGPSYGQYCTRIVNGILFHSVWYYYNQNKASQSTVQYNRLGTTASHGCVRLTVADCKWIYDNCPLSTKVIIFNGNSKDDPLGKPKSIIVSTASRMGWDPTDPDPENPYLKKEPVITPVQESYSVKNNTTLDLKEIVSARAAYGPYLDSLLKISIKQPKSNKYYAYKGTSYRFTKVGTYYISYTVKDPKNGKTGAKVVPITVEDTGKPVISGVMSNKTVAYNTKLDLKSKVKVVTGSGTDLKSKLVVTIKNPSGKSGKLSANSYVFKQLGTYVITYSVKNPASQLEATKTIKITVKDTKAPTFSGSGIKDVNKEYKSVYNVRSGVYAKTTTGVSLTKKINVSVTDPSGSKVKVVNDKITLSKRGTYKVKYSVTGPNKKSAAKTKLVRVRDTGAPIISGTPTKTTYVNYKQTLDVRKGIKAATSKGTSLTSGMTITVTMPNGGQVVIDKNANNFSFNSVGTYSIVYSVKNSVSGKTATKTCKYVSRYLPEIVIPSSQTIDIANSDKEFNIKKDVLAVSAHDRKTSLAKVIEFSYTATYAQPYISNVNKQIAITNNSIAIDKLGIYKIKYSVTGNNVTPKSKTRTFNVIDSSKGYTVEPVNDNKIMDNEEVNLVGMITASTTAGTTLNNAIDFVNLYKVNEDGSKVLVMTTQGKVQNLVAGKFVAEYLVKDSAKAFITNISKVEYSFEVEASSIDEGNNDSENTDNTNSTLNGSEKDNA